MDHHAESDATAQALLEKWRDALKLERAACSHFHSKAPLFSVRVCWDTPEMCIEADVAWFTERTLAEIWSRDLTVLLHLDGQYRGVRIAVVCQEIVSNPYEVVGVIDGTTVQEGLARFKQAIQNYKQ